MFKSNTLLAQHLLAKECLQNDDVENITSIE